MQQGLITPFQLITDFGVIKLVLNDTLCERTLCETSATELVLNATLCERTLCEMSVRDAPGTESNET